MEGDLRVPCLRALLKGRQEGWEWGMGGDAGAFHVPGGGSNVAGEYGDCVAEGR